MSADTCGVLGLFHSTPTCDYESLEISSDFYFMQYYDSINLNGRFPLYLWASSTEAITGRSYSVYFEASTQGPEVSEFVRRFVVSTPTAKFKISIPIDE